MTDYPNIFEEDGHPTIKVFEDKISVKAIDYHAFRDFSFEKIKDIEFFRPYENSLFDIPFMFFPWKRFRDTDDFVLRIKLKDGEHWDYQTTYKYRPSFKRFIEALRSKLKP